MLVSNSNNPLSKNSWWADRVSFGEQNLCGKNETVGLGLVQQ